MGDKIRNNNILSLEVRGERVWIIELKELIQCILVQQVQLEK
jgi:hypothetical protein